MNRENTKTVISERLILQPVSDEFKFEICREFTVEVTKYMPFTPNGDVKVIEGFIARSNEELSAGKGIQFCILDRETREFLGVCGLHNTDTAAIEIGLWLKIGEHKKGYGTEAVRTLIKLAEEHFKFDYLYYPVDKDNIPSRNIPEKFGFTAVKEYLLPKSPTENLNIVEYQKRHLPASKIV
jgi:[ribosomal protein S5]-alanine N-acetyltransferase